MFHFEAVTPTGYRYKVMYSATPVNRCSLGSREYNLATLYKEIEDNGVCLLYINRYYDRIFNYTAHFFHHRNGERSSSFFLIQSEYDIIVGKESTINWRREGF